MASFIGIVDFSEEARWLYMTESVTDLLGYEPPELIGRPSLELVHPDEFTRVKKLHTYVLSFIIIFFFVEVFGGEWNCVLIVGVGTRSKLTRLLLSFIYA